MREALRARIEEAIELSLDPAQRDALLSDLVRWQAQSVPAYGRLVSRHRAQDPTRWPAMPTDVFRYARVASHPPTQDVRVFRTSGTTSGARGQHAFRDLSLYDKAAELAARAALFEGVDRMDLIILAPRPEEAPDSSLSYMLGRFASWFGNRTRWLDPIDERLDAALEETSEPVALLGTSFAFVHAEDRLQKTYMLPPGSRVMQTGGYKGRSREVAPEALRRALSQRYGVPEPWIRAEYGMTELSSQMYERGTPGRLWVPPWVRARVVDPETLEELPDATRGILRIDDLANLDSVCAVQTSDLAIRHGTTLELLGRAPDATPRGCSLAVEEALG